MKPVTVVHFFALSGCDHKYVFSLLKQRFLKALKKVGFSQPNCSFKMKRGQRDGQVAEEHHQKEGPPLARPMDGGAQQRPTGQSNCFGLSDCTSGFCKAAVASLCRTAALAWVCGGGDNIF